MNDITEILRIVDEGLKNGELDFNTIDEFGMFVAEVVAKKSKDPNTKVGSCIISNEGELLSIGYNSEPKGWKGNFPWGNNIKEVGEINTKYPYVIHSECNAINNYEGPKDKLENATIYVTLFPCNNCSKQIIQSGIKRVVYISDKYKDTEDNIKSKILLTRCGIEFIQMDMLEKEKVLVKN